MREIKFRAWDKKVSTWLYHFCIRSNGEFVRYSDDEANGGEDIYNYEGDNENVFVTQYTGLKDKNGKEIYEGDLLKHDSENVIFKTYWANQMASFATEEVKNGWDPMTKYGGISSDFTKESEVIGNIYENPELLE